MVLDTEHRNAIRAPVAGNIRFWLWNEAKVANGGEISESGIFLRTRDVEAEGSHVTVRIELPGFGAMTVLGRVVRTVRGGLLDVAGMGIRFLDLVPLQRALIESFVSRRMLPELA